MLSSSGPANIAGNKVRTSIFMAVSKTMPETTGHRYPARPRLTFRPFFDDFEAAALSLFRAAHLQQGADGVNRRALFADDLADIGGMEAQLVNRRAFALHRGNGHRVRTVHQTLDD